MWITRCVEKASLELKFLKSTLIPLICHLPPMSFKTEMFELGLG